MPIGNIDIEDKKQHFALDTYAAADNAEWVVTAAGQMRFK